MDWMELVTPVVQWLIASGVLVLLVKVLFRKGVAALERKMDFDVDERHEKMLEGFAESAVHAAENWMKAKVANSEDAPATVAGKVGLGDKATSGEVKFAKATELLKEKVGDKLAEKAIKTLIGAAYEKIFKK